MTTQLPPGVIEVEHCEILDEPPANLDAAREYDEERNREGHYAFDPADEQEQGT